MLPSVSAQQPRREKRTSPQIDGMPSRMSFLAGDGLHVAEGLDSSSCSVRLLTLVTILTQLGQQVSYVADPWHLRIFAITYPIGGVVGTGRTPAVRRLLAVSVAQCVFIIIYKHNQAKKTGCYSEKMTRYTKISNT